MMLLAMIFFGLTGKIADIETVFLYGELEEEIYMKCPPGVTGVTQDDILDLLMYIYELVQVAGQYHRKMVKILKYIGSIECDVDTCLFCKKGDT